jgi:hypothetical protein
MGPSANRSNFSPSSRPCTDSHPPSASQFGAFIFFGAVTTLGVLWVWFFVPETKGRTLEEMDELFGEVGFAQADLSRKQKIERDIGLTALLNGGTAGDVSPIDSTEKNEGVKVN